MIKNIIPKELDKIMKSEQINIIDVRESWEYEICKIVPSINVPLNQLPAYSQKLEPSSKLYVVCHSGIRSQSATEFLVNRGFDAVNVEGGVDLWAESVDRSMKRY